MRRAPFTLAVDLDNTVFHYDQGFINTLASLGKDTSRIVTPAQSYKPTEAGWFDTWQDFTDAQDEAVAAGLFSTMPVLPGAIEALTELSKDPALTIQYVTARGIGRNADLAYETTLQRLKDENINFGELIFAHDKRPHMGDLIVDDAPDHITAAQEQGSRVLAMHQRYNSHLKVPRAYGWSHALWHITSIRSASHR